MGGGGAKHAFVATIGDRSVAGPSDGRHSCRPWCMRASPPKQVLAPTGRNSFPGPPGTYRICLLGAHEENAGSVRLRRDRQGRRDRDPG